MSVVVGVLLAGVALSPWNAVAATQQHWPRPAERSAVRPFGSVALFGSAKAVFRVARGVDGTKPHPVARLTTKGGRAVATGIGSGGGDGLMCTDRGKVHSVHHLRTRPTLGRSVNGAAYTDEGGKGYVFFCDGVSVHDSFALVTGDSQGVLQLVRKHGKWSVDKRVHSAGVNEGGQPHVRGWIRFPSSLSATRFTNVSIAPEPLHKGTYLAVAIDHRHDTLTVIEGVGTAKPRMAGSLTDPLVASSRTILGNGGLAWLPGARSRALITTSRGFAVLDLRNPAKPRLRASTRLPGRGGAWSITVSPNGNHVAVAEGSKVFGYGHVRAAVRQGRRFRRQTIFRLGTAANEVVRDVAYTANGNLVVLHGRPTAHGFLTVVRKVPQGHHRVTGSMRTTLPASSGSLSVWPRP